MRCLRLVGCAAAVLALGACTSPPSGTAPVEHPNFLFVLVDDMDAGLLGYLPHVKQMQQQGVTFANFTVTDSLCCPSRASILSGKYPHNTGVLTNEPPDGGFDVFHHRDEQDTLGTQLQQGGYRTGFLGKYLNGYQPDKTLGGDRPFVPPGWNEWAVAGDGYANYDYKLNVNGKVESHGTRPEDYLTDVLARRGDEFIRSSAGTGKPFFLEVATFAPHGPATPAPRHANALPGLAAPRTPAFDEADLSDKPAWLRDHRPLTVEEARTLDRKFGKRARSLLAVDEMLAGFQRILAETGQADRTYVAFTSDNGFHMGEHRLLAGKQTAFDTDIHVPFVATGPGVPAARTIDQPVQNIDLRPTFADLAGLPARPDLDGVSVKRMLLGDASAAVREVALIEHHGPKNSGADPDHQDPDEGNPPTYAAIRTPDGTYVEYVTGEREYYDRRSDPDQLDNSYARLPEAERDRLHRTLNTLVGCHGVQECTVAEK
jgi:N-acetylglucosamine-6-sulfatase